MIRTYVLSMPHFSLTRLSTWGIRISVESVSPRGNIVNNHLTEGQL